MPRAADPWGAAAVAGGMGLIQSLAQQAEKAELQRKQSIVEAIAQRQAEENSAWHALRMQQAQQQMARTAEQDRNANIETALAPFAVGDTLPNAVMAQIKDTPYEHRGDRPVAQAQAFGVTEAPSIGGTPGILIPGPVQDLPMDQGIHRGTEDQRRQQAQDVRQAATDQRLLDQSRRQVIDGKLFVQDDAGHWTQAIDATTPQTLLRVSADRRGVERFEAGDWVPHREAIPQKNVHWITEPTPNTAGRSAIDSRINQRVARFDSSPIAKDTESMEGHWARVQDIDLNLTGADGAAQDAMLIYTYAKAMDPASAVREGEYATVQTWATNRKDSFMLNMLRTVQEAQMLTPEARRAIRDRIQQTAMSQRRRFNSAVDQLGRDLERINPGETNWRDPLPLGDEGSTGAPDPLGLF